MSKLLLVLAVVGALALAGCASSNNNSTTTPTTSTMMTTTTPSGSGGMGEALAFTATQSGPPGPNTTYSFSGPDSTTAGWHTVSLTNKGFEPHELVWMKLAPGETPEQHMQAMMAMMTPPSNDTMSNGTMSNDTMGNGSSMSGADKGLGGPVTAPPVPPGVNAPPYNTTESVTLFLEPGSYVVECEIPGAAGPHMFHGMMKQVNVTGNASMDQGAPSSDLSVSLKEYQFVWTGKPTAGHHLIKVTNDGTMPHEIVLAQLAPNATVDDALNFTENPQGAPPFGELFGTGQLDPGQTVYVVADLSAGSYGELCLMPSPNGTPHAALGMKGQFTVA
jgi:uncharacterized cupredoxin-like copper-binding protein